MCGQDNSECVNNDFNLSPMQFYLMICMYKTNLLDSISTIDENDYLKFLNESGGENIDISDLQFSTDKMVILTITYGNEFKAVEVFEI